MEVTLVCVSPDVEPLDMQRVMGVPATRTWRRGDRIGRGTLVFQHYGWQLDSGLSPSATLGEHVEALLAQCSQEALRAVVALGCELELAGTVYIRRETPVLSLTHRQLLLLGEYRIDLDLDLLPG
jgi:hypothetical protein